jgi:hypothetical protein
LILKPGIVSLALFALCLAAVPVMAQTVYSNGPINGQESPWQIAFGFVTSDTFTVPTGGAQVNGLVFGAWLEPGDALASVQVSITSSEFGGTTYFSDTVNFTQSGCFTNNYGFEVCTETSDRSFGSVNLASGTYWLNLENAVTPAGDPVYWDENSGPSSASYTAIGTIPSESFTVLGTTSSTSTSGTVPEPGSIMLFCSGILGLAGVLRRRLL